jgi:hypothetical protein
MMTNSTFIIDVSNLFDGIKNGFENNFKNPILNGIDFFLHRNTGTNPLYKKWFPHLNEGQQKNGIVTHTAKLITTYALIHLLIKRGYGCLIGLLNLNVPEIEGIDMTMWNILS